MKEVVKRTRKVKHDSGLSNTIKWWKVKCSLFDSSFAVETWEDLIHFMNKTVGFDYEIKGMRSSNITDVDAIYEKEDGFIKL